MKTVLDAAWMIYTALGYCGIAVALGGVAVFGWHFVRANARAARDDMNKDAPVAWGGVGAKRGLQMLALGILFQVAAFLLGALLPSRL